MKWEGDLVMNEKWKVGDRYAMDGKTYYIKEELHAKLFLVEEIEPIGDDLFNLTGRESYATAWELQRFAARL